MQNLKKKILIRIGSLRHGGAEKVLVTFLKSLPSDKYEIDLLLNLYSGKYLAEVPQWINVLYLNKGEMITTNRIQDIPQKVFRKIYQALLKRFPKLLYNHILKGKKFDIEIAANHGLSKEILKSVIVSSKKIVWIHSDLLKSTFKIHSKADLQNLFSFDRVMVISKEIQADFERIAPNETDKKRVVRIYNPLDTQEILSKSIQKQDLYSFNSKIPTFVSIGTIYPAKGFDRLLRVHKLLLDEGFEHKLLILGDGYDFENVKNLKSELELDDSVTMLGFTDNPYPYLKRADYFVLSSRYEGFPTVLFEAITLKKNIIATDVSGVKEMLEDGKLGLIVENSEEGIYAGMKKAWIEPEIFNDYQTVLENYKAPFSLEKSVMEIQKIIDSL